MKFALPHLIALATSAFAVQVTFDPVYDNSKQSLDTVACSTLLETQPDPIFGDLPGFPNIGGASVVTGFDSPGCGTCWALTFNNLTINILAIDVADNGFNIAESTFNLFTNGQATQLGVIDVSAVQVDASACGP
ncbi:Cerato-platanin [Ramaria rubella]|nr:Cerato-platanin [Ramaria rubella]